MGGLKPGRDACDERGHAADGAGSEDKTARLEKLLDINFKDLRLLVQALTHSSCEGVDPLASNERLEFLGGGRITKSKTPERPLRSAVRFPASAFIYPGGKTGS